MFGKKKKELKQSSSFSKYASVESIGVHTAVYKGPHLQAIARLSSQPPSGSPSAPAPGHSRFSPPLHLCSLRSQLDSLLPPQSPRTKPQSVSFPGPAVFPLSLSTRTSTPTVRDSQDPSMSWTIMTITKKHHGAGKLAHLGRVLASKPKFDSEKPTC